MPGNTKNGWLKLVIAVVTSTAILSTIISYAVTSAINAERINTLREAVIDMKGNLEYYKEAVKVVDSAKADKSSFDDLNKKVVLIQETMIGMSKDIEYIKKSVDKLSP